MSEKIFKLNLHPDQIRDIAQTLKGYAQEVLKTEPQNENALTAMQFYEDIINLTQQLRPLEPNVGYPIIINPNKFKS